MCFRYAYFFYLILFWSLSKVSLSIIWSIIGSWKPSYLNFFYSSMVYTFYKEGKWTISNCISFFRKSLKKFYKLTCDRIIIIWIIFSTKIKIYTSSDFVKSLSNESGEKLKGDFIFSGSGYGHGVGLSQSGARGMAEAGYGYKKIIMHYFTGVEVH